MRWLPLLLAALGLLAAACTVPVQHGLDEGAANEVVTALERAGVGAAKEKEEGAAAATFLVRVGRGDSGRAMELMRALGLPRRARQGFAETYAQPSLVPTATEERARYLEALGSELERTLETIDGVVGARVHIVLPETDPLAVDGKPRVPAQAAVLLKARGGAPPVKEADVQKLVAGSVPGLQPAAVAVVLTAAPDGPAPGAPALAPLGPLRLAPGSRGLLVGGLGVGLLVVAGLAVALLVLARRVAALQRALAERRL
jgi:type III secretion protein J